jgi:transcriptional regulator with XRE-family HTH domain
MIRGDRLRELRKQRNLTADEVAAAIKTSRAQIVNIENGKASPSVDLFVRLLNYYGIGADYLLGVTEAPNFVVLSPEEAALIACVRAKDWARLLTVTSAIIAQGGIKPVPNMDKPPPDKPDQ